MIFLEVSQRQEWIIYGLFVLFLVLAFAVLAVVSQLSMMLFARSTSFNEWKKHFVGWFLLAAVGAFVALVL